MSRRKSGGIYVSCVLSSAYSILIISDSAMAATAAQCTKSSISGGFIVGCAALITVGVGLSVAGYRNRSAARGLRAGAPITNNAYNPNEVLPDLSGASEREQPQFHLGETPPSFNLPPFGQSGSDANSTFADVRLKNSGYDINQTRALNALLKDEPFLNKPEERLTSSTPPAAPSQPVTEEFTTPENPKDFDEHAPDLNLDEPDVGGGSGGEIM